MNQIEQLQSLITMLKTEFGETRAHSLFQSCVRITAVLQPEVSVVPGTDLQVPGLDADGQQQQSL